MRKNENVAEKTAKSAESTSFRNDYDVSVINAVANLLQLTAATDSIVFEKRKCHRVFSEIPRVELSNPLDSALNWHIRL